VTAAGGRDLVAEGRTRLIHRPAGRAVPATFSVAEVGVRLAAAAAWYATSEFNATLTLYWHRFQHLSIHHLPYRDFMWEYPPLSVLPVLPARLLGLRPFHVTFVALMIAAEYAGLRALRRAFPAHAEQLTIYWTAVIVVALPFSWFVVDPLSVLFVCLAIVAFRAGRDGSFVGSTTLGVAAKLWPGVLVAVPALARRWRAVVSTVLSVVGFLAAWWAFAPSGFDTFRRYREGSGFEIESLPAVFGLFSRARVQQVSGSEVVYAGQLRWVGHALVALWILLVLACVFVGLRRPVDALPLLTGLVVALLLLSRIFSLQYLLWAVPFFALLWARRERLLPTIYAACCLVTLAVFSLWWSVLVDERAGGLRPWVVLALTLRNLVLTGVAVALVAQAFHHPERATYDVALGPRTGSP
jgi:hypothetical protein